MKQRKLSPLLAVTISLELMVSPLAFANEKKEKGVTADQVFGTVLGVASHIYNTVAGQNMQPSPQLVGDISALNRQQQPLPDKYFNPQKLSQIPGLGQYLAISGINPNSLSCVTLPTNLYEAHNEVCRVGVTGDKGNPAMQAYEAAEYMKTYASVEKTYKNFSSQSNVGGELFGVGCMRNAMQVLNGFFKYRIDELDKMVTNIEAIQASFKEASRADLDAIEEQTAVLSGGTSELANKVRTKRPDLFDFGKRFGDASCSSMFTKTEFNNFGKTGLSNISQQLTEATSKKGGNFSAETYGRNSAEVVADIDSLADKVGKQMELNFSSLSGGAEGYSKVIGGLGGLSSANGLNKALSPDLFADVETGFFEKINKLKDSQNDIQSELGGAAGNAMTFVTSENDSTFEAEVAKAEIGIKNKCLSEQAQLDTVLEKIYDPSASNFANKNASNFMKDKLKQIMSNGTTSFEKKLSELQGLEGQQGSRYVVRMENSYEVSELGADGTVQKKVVPASNARTPGAFFSDVIKSCQAQFQVNSNGGKLSPAAAVQKLRQLHQDYRQLAKTHANDVKKALRKRLIECDSPAKANATTPGSCSSEVFDTSKSTFCAAAANTCSKKMVECSKKAEKFVTDIKKDRTARVTNYKNMVEKNKRDIIKIFDTALGTYMRDGELLRAQFGAGFTSPAGIEREVPEGSRFLSSFKSATDQSPDGALLLEDPAKFVDMFKKNISLLKNSVKEQQEKILGGDVGGQGGPAGGILAAHIKQTEDNFKKVASEASKFSKECQGQHDKYVLEMEAARKQQMAEMQKKNTELGEKTQKFCSKYGLAMENPAPGCKGGLEDISTAVAGLPGGSNAGRSLQNYCSMYNNEGGDTTMKALSACGPLKEGPKKEEPKVTADLARASREADREVTKKKEAKDKAEKAVTEAKTALDTAEAAVKTAEAAKAAAEAAKTTADKGKDKAAKDKAKIDSDKAKSAYDDAVAARDQKKTAHESAKTNFTSAETAFNEADEKKFKLDGQKEDITEGYAAEAEKKKEKPEDKDKDKKTASNEMSSDCLALYKCQGKTTTGTGKDKEVTTACTSAQESSIAMRILESHGQASTLDDPPAFCTAGNGTMGPPKNFFDAFKQGMDRGFAGGAIGQ